MILYKKWKDNANKARFLPLEIKNNRKQLGMEQGLYAQVVKLCRKDLKFIAVNKNKNEDKIRFQGKFARSQRWFDHEFGCIAVHFSTCEPDLYKKHFQIHDNTQDTNKFKTFKL